MASISCFLLGRIACCNVVRRRLLLSGIIVRNLSRALQVCQRGMGKLPQIDHSGQADLRQMLN